jgi:hypothetical protein
VPLTDKDRYNAFTEKSATICFKSQRFDSLGFSCRATISMAAKKNKKKKTDMSKQEFNPTSAMNYFDRYDYKSNIIM